jgi:hypothetical protein
MVCDRIHILTESDKHTGTQVDLTSQFRLPVSTLNTLVKEHDATDRNYI